MSVQHFEVHTMCLEDLQDMWLYFTQTYEPCELAEALMNAFPMESHFWQIGFPNLRFTVVNTTH